MKKSYIFGYNIAHKSALLFADLLSLLFAFYLPSILRVGLTPDYQSIEFISLAIVILSCIFIGNGYAVSSLVRAPRLPFRTFFIVIASAVPCLFIIYFMGVERFTFLFGRGIFPLAILIMGVLCLLNRVILNLYVFKLQNQSCRNVTILGNTNCKKWLNKSLTDSNIDIECKYYSRLDELNDIDTCAIVITPQFEPDSTSQKELINRRLNGTPVLTLLDFIENFLYLIPVQEINDRWFIQTSGFSMLHNSVALRIKRIVDVCVSVLLFILTLPISITTAIIIKASSPGSIFFSQTRVGINGKKFTIYKFRTMHTDAEKSGAQWAKKNDSRIIPCGNFLRKTRIDEIPQCWNILKGEMSFIGPRPERPEFTQTLNKEIPYYDLRHVIKPGLSGWAQVKYPYGASTEDSLKKLQYDLYYIKNYSLLLDLNIVLRTIKIILLRGGR